MASVAPEMQPLETQIHEGAAADVDTVAKQTLAPSAADAYVRELQGWERGVAEHHAEETPKCPVLHPEHQFRKKWDLAQVGALIYVAFLVPCTLRAGVAAYSSAPCLPWPVCSRHLMSVTRARCSPHRVRG